MLLCTSGLIQVVLQKIVPLQLEPNYPSIGINRQKTPPYTLQLACTWKSEKQK